MKKLLGILILVFVFALTACGGDKAGEEGDKAPAKENDTKTVKVWHFFSGKQQEIFDQLVKEYNDTQDEVKVVSEYVPFPDIKKQLSVGVAGGTLPDMITVDNVDNSALAAMGVLADLTPKLDEWGKKDKFYEGPMNSTVFEDKYYGLPFASNCLGLFYNIDLLKEAGFDAPPTTWDELRTYAKALTKDGQQGFAMSAVKSEEGTFQYYPYLKSSGGDYTDLDSPESVKALTFVKSLLDDGSMGKEVVNATQDDIARQFSQGKLAMMINGPWNISRVQAEGKDLNFAIGSIPKDKEFASVLGGENFALIKDGNVDKAWDFMEWLYEDERYEKTTSEMGIFPSNREILEGSDYWKNDQYLSGFVPIMDVADPRGPSPEWPKISEAIQLAMQETLTNTKSPEEALAAAAKKVDAILSK